MNSVQPDICIYHADCLDGFTAAWAIWLKWGNHVKFIPAQHGQPIHLPALTGEERILFVDFSASIEVLKDLASRVCRVTVLDHHKTAQAALRPLLDDGTVEGVFDMEKSGARLAWEHARPGERSPLLVDFVEDRDLWRFRLAGTPQCQAWLSTLPMTFESWGDANLLLKMRDGYDRMIAWGNSLLAKQEKEIEQVLKASMGRRVWLAGALVPVANCPAWLASEIGNRLSEGHPFSATYFDAWEGRRWSLRSQKDGGQDVSAIAQQFGGGGHKNAAGFGSEPSWFGQSSP